MFGDLGDYRLSETISMSERRVIAITDVRFDVSSDLTPIVNARFPHLTRLVCVSNEQEGRRYQELGMESVVDDKEHPGEPMALRILACHQIEKAKTDEWLTQRHESSGVATSNEA